MQPPTATAQTGNREHGDGKKPFAGDRAMGRFETGHGCFVQIFGVSILTLTDWWFGTMEFYDVPYIYIGNVIIPTDFHIFHMYVYMHIYIHVYWECHHPN